MESISLEAILEEIKQDQLLQVPTSTLKGKTIHFRLLSKNERFTSFGVRLMQERNFDDAETIFRAMLDRGETSSATRNNYGAVILEKAFSTLSEGNQVRPSNV